jgi:hypothetical protein
MKLLFEPSWHSVPRNAQVAQGVDRGNPGSGADTKVCGGKRPEDWLCRDDAGRDQAQRRIAARWKVGGKLSPTAMLASEIKAKVRRRPSRIPSAGQKEPTTSKAQGMAVTNQPSAHVHTEQRLTWVGR